MVVNLYKPTRYADRVLGTAVDFIVTPDGDARLVSITAHFDTAPTTSQNITVRLRYPEGNAYTTLLLNEDMQNDTDLLYQPDDVLLMPAGSSLRIQYTNTDARTIGTLVVVEEEGE